VARSRDAQKATTTGASLMCGPFRGGTAIAPAQAHRNIWH
jgi:hypothetical protein